VEQKFELASELIGESRRKVLALLQAIENELDAA